MTLPPGRRRGAGNDAEHAACGFLEERGLKIAARNYRVRGGEIDIVARQGTIIVFVEVRSREDGERGTPEETVGRAKRLRVAAAARKYLAGIAPAEWTEARFDVVAIEGPADAPDFRYYPGAFDAKGKIL